MCDGAVRYDMLDAHDGGPGLYVACGRECTDCGRGMNPGFLFYCYCL